MKMPSLFIGHGSPMNAIQKNAFSESLGNLAAMIPKPKAILAVSAHWRTHGTQILKAAQPKTIHDFSGFPKELSEIQYPAPGDPALAEKIAKMLDGHSVSTTEEWGLDHGTWSVLIHMYPKADIPVLQLGLNRRFTLKEHFELAKALRPLRDEGVLILGSGNIVHNLGDLNWDDEHAEPFSWAKEFDEYVKKAILSKNWDELYLLSGIDPAIVKKAVPTTEHYIPLLYALGASDANESVTFPYEGMSYSSLSMRSVKIS